MKCTYCGLQLGARDLAFELGGEQVVLVRTVTCLYYVYFIFALFLRCSKRTPSVFKTFVISQYVYVYEKTCLGFGIHLIKRVCEKESLKQSSPKQ